MEWSVMAGLLWIVSALAVFALLWWLTCPRDPNRQTRRQRREANDISTSILESFLEERINP
jgi:hypothetical protein